MKQSELASPALRQVVFDLGQVCTKAQRPDKIAVLAESFGLSPNDFVNAYFERRKPYDAGRIGAAEFWQTMPGKTVKQIDWLIDQDYQSWNRPNRPILELARQLAKQVESLVLLSNMPIDLKERYLAEWPELSLFHRQYFSCDLGYCKPDPIIFRRVIGDSPIPAEQTLLIDDLTPNIAAAQALGWQTIWFQNNRQAIAEFRQKNIAHLGVAQ